ncbi:nuclear transport factor 2 family protein [Aquimarina sp. D1M17]|uniref:nuclear transport factor 2 family protein n=1 Tax=Aquimarina acroporae TaxID=2937283 RepID=UPI0020C0D83B|nr:nuclear transport factor 2 family protein [Aquimarina acroporae]MCK8521638.1 nuclear transport factor 2 family protein [Aquimarina acroporae]
MIFCLVWILGCQTTTESDTKHKKETLIKQIETFNNAFKEGNTELLASMITDNYVHTNGNSKAIHKENWINYLSKRQKEIESGELTVRNYEMKDTEIQLYQETAIVTSKIIVSTVKSDRLHENEFRVTNIWVLENGIWKRAGFHDGKIK